MRGVKALDNGGKMKEASVANQIGSFEHPGEASKARENEP